MSGTADSYSPRFGPLQSLVFWLAWLAGAAALSVAPFLWHLDYARSAHPQVFWVFAAFVAGVPLIVAPLYQRLRSARLWRIEPYLIGGLAVAVPLAYEPLATLVVAWLFLAAYAAGSTVLARLGLTTGSLTARLIYAFGLGFGILLWPLALFGELDLYRPWPLLILLALTTVLCWRRVPELARATRKLFAKWGTTAEFASLPVALAVVVATVLLVCGLAVALAPSITFDPLRFHLPLARHYAETGGLSVLKPDGYGYNPQNFEVLLTLGWVLAGQRAAQLISPLFTPLFALALFATGRRLGLGPAAAVLGAVLTTAVPYIHWDGVNVKHDVIVAFFQLAALIAYFEWRRTGNFRWIQFGTFLAATTFGFKHPAAFGILGLAALYIPAAWKQPRRLRAFASCAAIFLAFGTFWQVRAWVLAGNPFFYYDLSQPLPGDHAAQVGTLWNRIVTALTWPYRVHFEGHLFFRSDTSNPVGMLLFMFAPLWLLLRRRDRSPEARAALVFAGVALVLWSAYVPLLRFVIAPIAILVLLTVGRLYAWHASAGRLLRWSLRLATAWVVAFSLCVILILEINAPQGRYFTRQIDRRGYLRAALLTYPSLEALSSIAGPGDRVLGIHNCSMAYAPDPDLFYCRYFELDDPVQVEQIRASVTARSFKFVVRPSTPLWADVVRRLAAPRKVTEIYRDDHFAIDRLE